MRRKNLLIVGAGGVAHVAAHKAAQNNDVFGDIHIASRTVDKCHRIIDSVRSRGSLKNSTGTLAAHRIDAMDIPAMVALIRSVRADIVMNLGTSFINMAVLEACLATGASYIDTAIHEDPDKVCEEPPWYANHEWKRKDRCERNGVTAILGVGFDPGVVNAYCASAAKHDFDAIDTIDIMDVNAGSHGRFFATNFDPEINFREFKTVWSWIGRKWVNLPVHSEKWIYDFPVVGEQPVYLTGHDELHSLWKHIEADSIRFWMGFSDHYINCFNVLKNIGLLSVEPVKTAEGVEVVPLKLLKACLPDPSSLAPDYVGKTCIGVLVKGMRNGLPKSTFTYNVCDHAACHQEVGAQAISYTAGVPPVAAAMLVARGTWDVGHMVNVEQLDPDPFLDLLGRLGLPTIVEERERSSVALPTP